MNIIENENFKIEFIERVKIPLYFIYKIKISSKQDQQINSQSILCGCGVNLVCLNIYEINNIELFKTINMKTNETIEVYVAFQKTDIATNQPKFSFQNKFTRVRL